MNSIKTNDAVECIVLAGGSGVRLGMGPKAFVELGDRTLLEIAVQTMLKMKSKVIVALPNKHLDSAKILLSDSRITLIAGGKRRIETLRLLVEKSNAEWLILHDVVHPFVTVEISQKVLDAAYLSGAAAVALPMHEFLYRSDGKQIAQPGQALIIQKPIAFSSSAIKAGFAKADKIGLAHDASVLDILALADVLPSFVYGYPWNQKITTALDLQIASSLVSSNFFSDYGKT